MNRALVIALKEVRSYLRDRADLAFSLLLPVAIFALMYGAFSGQTLFNGTAYVVNEDPQGVYSQRLIERLAEQDELEVSLLTRQVAETKLERSDVLLVSIIPEGFSAQLTAGWPTEITFMQRGNGGQEGQIVASMVRGEADRLSQEIQAERQVRSALASKAISDDQIETAVRNLLERERELPLVEVTETLLGADTSMVHQTLPGIVAMFVLFAITMSSRTIVEERRKGTLERLLTTRLTVSEMFMGKFLAGTARGFVQTFLLLTLAYIVFRLFTPLSFLMVLLVALVFAAAASTLGLIIASMSRTDDQASWISVFFTMATVMLGGTFFEIPEGTVLHTIGKASINTYSIGAFQTLMAPGVGLADVSLELAVLAGVAVVGFILSRVLFLAVTGGR
jgi:ABC-2 type transport system permease protein